MNVYIIQDKPRHTYLSAGPEKIYYNKRKYFMIFFAHNFAINV